MRRFVAWLGCMIVLSSWGMAASMPSGGEVTMNFANADIRSVIKFVSEFSHKNFLVDNRVKGRVTIVSPTPIPAEDAYKVFLSILEVNGFTAVPVGNIVKIIPLAEGKQKRMPVSTGGETEGSDILITRLITLKHASAQQMVSVLRPLVSPQSGLTAYTPANILILTDTASNTDKVLQIIRALDVSEAVGVRLLPLKYASAEKVAKTLQGLYGSLGGMTRNAPGQGSAMISPVKIIAHNPGNILVIVASGATMPEIISVVRKLDVAPEPDSERLQVRYLKNADAEDVAKVINSLISGQTGNASGSRRRAFSGDVKVVADPATNALLITADPSDRKAMDALIDKLDIRRLQVLVEAMIIEISTDGAQQFGIEFKSTNDFTQPGRRPIGGTTFQTDSNNIEASGPNPLPGSGLVVGVVDGTISFGGVEFLNLAALLRALETKTDANVLSTPNILTMDNEEAEIIVGQNVPFVTGTQQTTGGLANPFQTIQREDVGLTLRVTPQISEGDTIRLKIFQEISTVQPKGEAADITTSKRSVKTVVLANDGNIIVLGGLMRDDTSTTVKRVPCIGAVPIIGEPFKFTENSHRKTNLMVFLRPHIIRSQKDIKAITSEKYRDIEGVYNSQKYEGTILFPHEKLPLPENVLPLRKSRDVPQAQPGDAPAKP